MRVLLVEDDPAVRHFIDAALTRRGHTVIAAPSAHQADAMLLEYQQHPDLSLLDLMLPGLNGLAYAEQLEAKFPEIRLVFISGWFEGPLMAEAAARGRLLTKPFTVPSLVAAVEQPADRTGRR